MTCPLDLRTDDAHDGHAELLTLPLECYILIDDYFPSHLNTAGGRPLNNGDPDSTDAEAIAIVPWSLAGVDSLHGPARRRCVWSLDAGGATFGVSATGDWPHGLSGPRSWSS